MTARWCTILRATGAIVIGIGLSVVSFSGPSEAADVVVLKKTPVYLGPAPTFRQMRFLDEGSYARVSSCLKSYTWCKLDETAIVGGDEKPLWVSGKNIALRSSAGVGEALSDVQTGLEIFIEKPRMLGRFRNAYVNDRYPLDSIIFQQRFGAYQKDALYRLKYLQARELEARYARQARDRVERYRRSEERRRARKREEERRRDFENALIEKQRR